jgi:hypothetical protein
VLKADISEAGEGWSDSRIIKALDTSASMIYRVRKQLVEENFEAVVSRKPRMTPPVAAIFDGEKQAKLIALACSKPPQGRARWTLRLLENKVVELGIVERASASNGTDSALLQDADNLPAITRCYSAAWVSCWPFSISARRCSLVSKHPCASISLMVAMT